MINIFSSIKYYRVVLEKAINMWDFVLKEKSNLAWKHEMFREYIMRDLWNKSWDI